MLSLTTVCEKSFSSDLQIFTAALGFTELSFWYVLRRSRSSYNPQPFALVGFFGTHWDTVFLPKKNGRVSTASPLFSFESKFVASTGYPKVTPVYALPCQCLFVSAWSQRFTLMLPSWFHSTFWNE
jgi:hypothetical protein